MARFVQQKDLAFFEKISKELVDVVVQTTVEIFKLSLSETKTNLYGESLGKSYLPAVQCACLIERDESSIEYEGFGPDRAQNAEFRFNRFTLEEKIFILKLEILSSTITHILKLIKLVKTNWYMVDLKRSSQSYVLHLWLEGLNLI